MIKLVYQLLLWPLSIAILLVGGAKTILKNMSSSMGRIIPYMKWKIKAMFQTTNQTRLLIIQGIFRFYQIAKYHNWSFVD